MIVGVIGLGSIGLVHAKNLLAMGHTVYGYDPYRLSDRDDDIHYADIGELLERCEAVVIASPSHLHQEHMAACWVAGKPILVEKPIINATIIDPFEATLNNATKNGLVVMCGNNMRYHPVVKLAKQYIVKYGKPQCAWFRVLQKNTKYTDPVTLNWGAHEVDMALYLVDGDLKVRESKASQDKAIFSLEHDGCEVGVMLDYLSEPWVRDFALHWDDVSLHADVQNFKMEIFENNSSEIIAVEGSHEQTYRDEMEEFIRRVEGHSTDGIGATGEDGLRCLKVLLEAMK